MSASLEVAQVFLDSLRSLGLSERQMSEVYAIACVIKTGVLDEARRAFGALETCGADMTAEDRAGLFEFGVIWAEASPKERRRILKIVASQKADGDAA